MSTAIRPVAGESRYVRQCRGPLCNGRVLGYSSFRKFAGQVSDECRNCEKARNLVNTQIARYERAERLTLYKLAHLRGKIRALRAGR